MSESIAGIACDFLHGSIPALKRRVETWEMPGVDGYGSGRLEAGDQLKRLARAAVSYSTRNVIASAGGGGHQ